MEVNVVTLLVCGIFGFLPGIAIGFYLGTMGQIDTILTMLKQFKSEGHDEKWLK